jgi:short subunit dehydrogenase-like uncharacterized protein
VVVLLIYGATGYTGELIARHAAERGLAPVVAGRREQLVAALGAELGTGHRSFALDDPAAVDRGIAGARVVLSCAGPFSRTAAALASGCVRARAHYLDITGEIAVFEQLAAMDAAARAAGVMLLPGTGFDVVPTDCLAAHLAARLPSARELRLAIRVTGGMSRGTALTSIEGMGGDGAVRRDGVLTRVPLGHRTIAVDFGDGGGGGKTKVIAIPWGDVFTAHVTTGIPNVEVYMALPAVTRAAVRALRWAAPVLRATAVRRLAAAWVRARGEIGPSAGERATGGSAVWGEARDGARAVVSRLRAPQPYALTVTTAVAIAARALAGEVQAGFQTPARVYGAELVMGVAGVTREDVAG